MYNLRTLKEIAIVFLILRPWTGEVMSATNKWSLACLSKISGFTENGIKAHSIFLPSVLRNSLLRANMSGFKVLD